MIRECKSSLDGRTRGHELFSFPVMSDDELKEADEDGSLPKLLRMLVDSIIVNVRSIGEVIFKNSNWTGLRGRKSEGLKRLEKIFFDGVKEDENTITVYRDLSSSLDLNRIEGYDSSREGECSMRWDDRAGTIVQKG